MKKYVLLFLVMIVVIPFTVNATDDTIESRTLGSSRRDRPRGKHPTSSWQQRTLIAGEIEHGGCGGPVVKFSVINSKFCVLTGGYGGWIINHTFLLGGGGYGLTTDVFVSGNKLYMSYGGLVVEYIGFSDALVHFKAGGLIGAGSAHLDPAGTDARGFFVLEPGVDVEINVASFVRVCAGVSYRFVIGAQGVAGLNDASLGGPAAELVLKFGWF